MMVDEPRLTAKQARTADAIQRHALRDATGVWERIKLRLSDRHCSGCGRSLYAFRADAVACGDACKKRTKRRREGAHAPERRQRRSHGLLYKRLRIAEVIHEQIHNGPLAQRTWGDLAASDPAYRSVREKRSVAWRDPDGNEHTFEVMVVHPEPAASAQPDSPPHPDNIAWVAAYRARLEQNTTLRRPIDDDQAGTRARVGDERGIRAERLGATPAPRGHAPDHARPVAEHARG